MFIIMLLGLEQLTSFPDSHISRWEAMLLSLKRLEIMRIALSRAWGLCPKAMNIRPQVARAQKGSLEKHSACFPTQKARFGPCSGNWCSHWRADSVFKSYTESCSECLTHIPSLCAWIAQWKRVLAYMRKSTRCCMGVHNNQEQETT